jgi:hypothetical protein
MGNSADDRFEHEIVDTRPATDWRALVRLGLVCGAFAALAAIALNEHLTDTTIVVCVIVAATMASWFQIEHPRMVPPQVPVRRE